MSNVTVINIEMMLQGPAGEAPDLATLINDNTIATDEVWSSSKTNDEILEQSIINAIIFG